MARRIGRYEVIAEIGRGGFGQVYRGHDPNLDKTVAIKLLTAAAEDNMLTRFRSEATLSARLRHPNVVTVHDFGEQDGIPYIVMEFLEGRDLQQVIRTRKLSLLEQLQIMMQIGAGLRYAHSSGVIHRDVKPANIMLQPDGCVKIMDFGIAITSLNAHTRLTPHGAMVGTFRYMAPEQFNGFECDARSDIFAYGLIFYQLLTGVHPFQAAEAATQMYNTVHVEPVPLADLCPSCPAGLQPVVSRLLEKDPELRYQSLDDVVLDIEPFVLALRRLRAAELIEEARAAQQQNQFEKAQSAVREALDLEPGLEKARELREQIQSQVRRQVIRPKVDDLVRKGRDALAGGNPTEAVERFESAIRLDPTDTALRKMLEEARSHAQNLREANRLSSEGFESLRAGDASAAARIAEQVVKFLPQHAAAQTLLAESRAALADEEKRKRLADSLVRVRRLINEHTWSEASADLKELRIAFPNQPELEALSDELRIEQDKARREQELSAGLAKARQSVQSGELQAAHTLLHALAARHPESEEVEKMRVFVSAELESASQYAFVHDHLERAIAAAAHRDFAQAVRILEGALERYPQNPELRRECNRFQIEHAHIVRRELVENANACAHRLRTSNRLPEALEILNSFLRDHGTDASVLGLRDEIAKEYEGAHRKSEPGDLVQHADQRLDRNRLDHAEGHTDNINEAQLNLAERRLASYIGPLAKVLVKRAAMKTSSVSELYSILARELDKEEDRKTFLRNRLVSPPSVKKDQSLFIAAGDATRMSESPSRQSDQVTPEQIDRAGKLLAPYLGPIAPVLARKEAKRTTDLHSFYDLLAGHVPDQVDRQRFLQQAGIKPRP